MCVYVCVCIHIHICVCIYVCIIEYYSAIKKESNYVIFKKVDGPTEYYAQWNKLDKERQNTVCYHLYVES